MSNVRIVYNDYYYYYCDYVLFIFTTRPSMSPGPDYSILFHVPFVVLTDSCAKNLKCIRECGGTCSQNIYNNTYLLIVLVTMIPVIVGAQFYPHFHEAAHFLQHFMNVL